MGTRIQRRPSIVLAHLTIQYRQPVQFLRQAKTALALAHALNFLQGDQLAGPPLAIVVVALLDAWRKALELAQIAHDRCCRGCQRAAVFGSAFVRVRLQLLQHEVGMAVEEQVDLLVIAFGFVDLGLGARSACRG